MIDIVLVKPTYPRNVGMCARSMENYGASRLILIDPQCDITSLEARQGAARAQKPLQEASIYKGWNEFHENEPEGLRIAFSRRTGRRRIAENYSEILKNFPDTDRSYFIFGPEADGLSESDLDLAHHICHFDIPGPNKSLNLSHAVNTALVLFQATKPLAQPGEPRPKIDYPLDTLRELMEALKIDIDSYPRVNTYSVLRKMFLRAYPTEKEWQMLEIVMRQSIRKLKEYHQHRKTLNID